MRSSVFCSCLTVYSVMRNTRLWQCRRGLCPSDWSTLCWRPMRMENSSLHFVIRFLQPQTWSCSKVSSPSTTSTLKDTSMLKIYCVQHAKKKNYRRKTTSVQTLKKQSATTNLLFYLCWIFQLRAWVMKQSPDTIKQLIFSAASWIGYVG